VARTLDRQRVGAATLAQQRDLAAVIHLCGVRAGEAFAARGFRLTANQRCGDQDVRGYLERINQIRRAFGNLMNVAQTRHLAQIRLAGYPSGT
jgi:hypothetical protein